MLKSYLKISLRNISKNKLYSSINLLSLVLGIGSFLFIYLYINDELSFDRHFSSSERIYRVCTNMRIEGTENTYSTTPGPLAEVLRSEFPEVEAATRIFSDGDVRIELDDLIFNERHVFNVDSNFFKIFDFKLIKGNPDKVLAEPNTMVITEEFEKKYFGNESAIGKILVAGVRRLPYKITGVVENPASNSHFKFNILISMYSHTYSHTIQIVEKMWGFNKFHTYVLLQKNTSEKDVDKKFPSVVRKNIGSQFQEALGYSFEQFLGRGGKYDFFLQPLTDIHLRSNFNYELSHNGSIQNVYLLSCVAVFLLIISCINYMTLSTATAGLRTKEVGVRKTLGSSRIQLMLQFILESTIFSCFAMIIAQQLLPIFNSLVGMNISYNYLFDWEIVLVILALILLVGILSGLYPSIYLTSNRNVNLAKNRSLFNNSASGIRNILVAIQFVISISLIICTLIINDQVVFLREKNPGYNQDDIIMVTNNHLLGNRRDDFINTLKKETSIVEAGVATNYPSSNNFQSRALRASETDADHQVYFQECDHNYIHALGITVLQGRNFSKEFLTDNSAVILNEAAVNELGLKEPIGKFVWLNTNEKKLQVIGVVKDFNYESMHKEIKPLAMQLLTNDDFKDYIFIKAESESINRALTLVQGIWKFYLPEEACEYTFLKDKFDSNFETEIRLSKLFRIFSVLIEIIACLGLFALATFVADQKAKEVSIRKVIGAGVKDIVFLLGKKFLLIIVVAFLIASPISYFLVNRWLQNFPYRTNVNLIYFLLSGLVTTLIASAIIGFHSYKAAIINPIKTLKSE